MKNWFNCKVVFDRTDNNGLIKCVAENYLVDAMSFAEAEARTVKECEPYATGEFKVASVRRCRIAEVMKDPNEGDKWFRCKVNYISLDEEKGIEKRIAQVMMVQADNLEHAVKVLIKGMEGCLSDYEIVSVVQTNILEIYECTPDNQSVENSSSEETNDKEER